MAAGTYNLTIEQGVTLSRLMTWRDSNNALVNLTGYTARAKVKASYASSTALLTLTTENGGISLGGVAGTITLSATAATTASLDFFKGVWDLELISSGGLVTRLLQGTCTLSKEATT